MKNLKSIIINLLLIMYAGLNVILAIFIKDTVDSALTKDVTTFSKLLVFTILVAVLELVFGILSRTLLQFHVMTQLVGVKNSKFIWTLKNRNEKKLSSSTYSTDIDLLYGNYYMNKKMLIYYICQFVFSLTGIIYFNGILSLIIIFTSFLPIFVPLFLQKKLSLSTQVYSESQNSYLNFINDCSNGIQEIRTYKALSFFEKIHIDKNSECEKSRVLNKLWIYINAVLSTFIGMLSFIVTIAVCGYLVIKGQSTIGTMIAVIQLLNTMVAPIGEIASIMGEISSTKPLVKEFNEVSFSNLMEDGNDFEPMSKINVKEVSFNYDAAKPLIEKVSFVFEKGKSYAIIGKSGSGKTTFAKLLSGSIEGFNGEINYINSSNEIIEPHKVRIHYVSQEPYLFELSAKDNITFGNYSNQTHLNDIVKDLGINEIIDNSTSKLSNRDFISGGQKQRLVIARALIHKPDVLILDEPTANIDMKSVDDIIDILLKNKDQIFIMITHDIRKEVLSKFNCIIDLGE